MTAYFFLSHNLETISLRYFNTYGIGEDNKGVYSSIIWKFVENASSGRQQEIYGDGRAGLHTKGYRQCIDNEDEKGQVGDAYNIGTGITTHFNKIFSIVKMAIRFKGEA